jgi:hypothetical protein
MKRITVQSDVYTSGASLCVAVGVMMILDVITKIINTRNLDSYKFEFKDKDSRGSALELMHIIVDQYGLKDYVSIEI